MTNETETVSVPRELLEKAIAKAYGEQPGNPDIEFDQLRALLAAPAEDDRAVVAPTDEQILEAMRKPIYEADGGYVWDYGKSYVLEAGKAVLALGKVVMPERNTLVMPDPVGATNVQAMMEGWNLCLNEFARLNPNL